MNLSEHIDAATQRLITSGKIEEAIEKQLERTIESIIEQELRVYSDFGKALHEQVKKALALDPDTLTLPGYNHVVLDVVQRALNTHVESTGRKHLEALCAEILKAPPESIKLSDLVNEYKTHITRYGENRTGEEIGLTVERERLNCTIGLAPKPGVEMYRSDFRLSVWRFRDDQPATISAIWLGDRNVRDRLFVGDVYGFERTLFQLWAAKTPIIIDEDDCEIEITSQE